MGRIVIMRHDGETETREASKSPELHELQELVEGYIEMIPLFHSHEGKPCLAICNEEGRLKGYQPNREATQLWHRQILKDARSKGIPGARIGSVYPLVGTVLLLVGKDLVEDFCADD